jgi:hypothetical protein
MEMDFYLHPPAALLSRNECGYLLNTRPHTVTKKAFNEKIWLHTILNFKNCAETVLHFILYLNEANVLVREISDSHICINWWQGDTRCLNIFMACFSWQYSQIVGQLLFFILTFLRDILRGLFDTRGSRVICVSCRHLNQIFSPQKNSYVAFKIRQIKRTDIRLINRKYTYLFWLRFQPYICISPPPLS